MMIEDNPVPVIVMEEEAVGFSRNHSFTHK
jgi:hypothetical protein